MPVIKAAVGRRLTGPLFLAPHGGRLTYPSLRKTWLRLIARLGYRYRAPHQLRHGCATGLVSAGVPLGDVAAYLGDSVKEVVETYLHPAGTDPSAAMNRLLKSGRKVGNAPTLLRNQPASRNLRRA
jgi:integrase